MLNDHVTAKVDYKNTENRKMNIEVFINQKRYYCLYDIR